MQQAGIQLRGRNGGADAIWGNSSAAGWAQYLQTHNADGTAKAAAESTSGAGTGTGTSTTTGTSTVTGGGATNTTTTTTQAQAGNGNATTTTATKPAGKFTRTATGVYKDAEGNIDWSRSINPESYKRARLAEIQQSFNRDKELLNSAKLGVGDWWQKRRELSARRKEARQLAKTAAKDYKAGY